MSSTKATGGPAYPTERRGDLSISPGMTLRDWFAGQALAGAINTALPPRVLAYKAYDLADAMIAARDNKDGA
jgi:hypothetical protein